MVTFYRRCNITWLSIKIKREFGSNRVPDFVMKIIYDYQIFSIQKYGGISKYFCELIKNLPTEHECKLSLLLSDNQYVKEGYQYFKKRTVTWPDKKFKGKGFLNKKLYKINRLYSKHIISSNNYDLLHPTYYDTYFLHGLKKPYIFTVHDLIEFKFKELYRTNSLMPQMEKVIKSANRIISISENTKEDLINIFNINPEKIDVIYHGFNKPLCNGEPNPFGRYILFVGKRGGYKNFITFASAVSVLLKKESDLKLICVGYPFSKEEIDDLRNLKILEKTISLGVNENKLNNLYYNAQVFVYPTLYEGFGMPILEAFANNCPVCLSNTSSLPEVAGNAGVYFDPNDRESILNAVEKVIYDSDYKKKIIDAGRNRLNNFSWKYCAEQTVNSYKKTLSYSK